ncbi:MAG: TetR/AcrR family transcriptional regulator [Desulfovibrio sp.]|uniref:TetR/AcrR family transcriptional regulator n=1 Tax=Desulfovibrio sp. 7SRBS1 TaxID=3378064 RepID=UPI003B3F2A37
MTDNDTFTKLDPQKKMRILDVAMDEFSEHGYQGASVNRMVRRMGIAKGSIFSYFGSKDGLFEYVFERAVGLFSGSLRRVRDTTLEADVFTRIRQSLDAGIRFIDNNPRIYRIYLKMLFQENFPGRERFLSTARLYSAKYLRPLVVQGQERGELRSGLDPDWVVFFLDALMDRFLQAYAVPYMDSGTGLHNAPAAELEERLEQLMSIIRHGLAPDGKGADAAWENA